MPNVDLITVPLLNWPYAVLSIANNPPASPSLNDCYLIGDSPTGAWAGRAQQIARRNASGVWEYQPPAEGRAVYVRSDDNARRYNGTAWILYEARQADIDALNALNAAQDAVIATALAAVPTGGTPGQILGKASPADRHTAWIDPPVGGGGGSGGAVVLNGTGAPSSLTGANGDFYIDTAVSHLYGPKTAGAWGSGVALIGPVGPQGPSGQTGQAGPVGPQGPVGNTGAQGPDGPAGSTGPTGPQGLQGPAGSAGAQGLTGPAGPAGATGPQGPVGNTGPQGASGTPGATGPQGPAGATGPQGPVGNTGPQGASGTPGATGPQGPAGPGLPAGGATGQSVRKASATDFDFEFYTPSTGPAAPSFPVTVTLQSGVGFVGTILVSTAAGQWTRDGADIAGATGTTYTVVQADVGAALRCGNSNTFQLWTPVHLPAAAKTNGGWWDFSDPATVTLNGGNVASVANKFGGTALAQASASLQPPYVAGYLNWPFSASSASLVATNIRTGTVAIVHSYRNGTEVLGVGASELLPCIVAPLGGAGLAPLRTGGAYGTVGGWGDSDRAELPFHNGETAQSSRRWGPFGTCLVRVGGLVGALSTITHLSVQGRVYSIMVIPELDPTLQQRVDGFLMWYHGIQTQLPVGHPYYSAPPKGASHT